MYSSSADVAVHALIFNTHELHANVTVPPRKSSGTLVHFEVDVRGLDTWPLLVFVVIIPGDTSG